MELGRPREVSIVQSVLLFDKDIDSEVRPRLISYQMLRLEYDFWMEPAEVVVK